MNYLVALIICIFAAIAGLMIMAPGDRPAPSAVTYTGNERVAIGGAFSLNDQDGKRITDRDFPGKYKLVFFGFTHCPEICPTTLATITLLMKELGNDGKKIAPIFISVDAKDNPEIMKDYLKNFDKSITGLTGTEAEIKKAAEAYRVYYQKVPQNNSGNGYTMDHSTYVYLIDENNNYLTHLGYNDNVDKMAEKIRPFLAR